VNKSRCGSYRVVVAPPSSALRAGQLRLQGSASLRDVLSTRDVGQFAIISVRPRDSRGESRLINARSRAPDVSLSARCLRDSRLLAAVDVRQFRRALEALRRVRAITLRSATFASRVRIFIRRRPREEALSGSRLNCQGSNGLSHLPAIRSSRTGGIRGGDPSQKKQNT